MRSAGSPKRDCGFHHWLSASTAALLAAEGVSFDQALETVTISAATILGQGERLGSIGPGKDADMIQLSGHPFDITSRVERAWVNGKTVEEDAGG